jgi:hypothetical protein
MDTDLFCILCLCTVERQTEQNYTRSNTFRICDESVAGAVYVRVGGFVFVAPYKSTYWQIDNSNFQIQFLVTRKKYSYLISDRY